MKYFVLFVLLSGVCDSVNANCNQLPHGIFEFVSNLCVSRHRRNLKVKQRYSTMSANENENARENEKCVFVSNAVMAATRLRCFWLVSKQMKFIAIKLSSAILDVFFCFRVASESSTNKKVGKQFNQISIKHLVHLLSCSFCAADRGQFWPSNNLNCTQCAHLTMKYARAEVGSGSHCSRNRNEKKMMKVLDSKQSLVFKRSRNEDESTSESENKREEKKRTSVMDVRSTSKLCASTLCCECVAKSWFLFSVLLNYSCTWQSAQKSNFELLHLASGFAIMNAIISLHTSKIHNPAFTSASHGNGSKVAVKTLIPFAWVSWFSL